MKSSPLRILSLLAVVTASSTGDVLAATGTTTTSPSLPPPGVYVSPDDYHRYLDMGIRINDPAHEPFLPPIDVRSQPNAGGGADDEVETFNSIFHGEAQTLLGDPIGTITMNGPTQVITYHRGSGPTGTFDTEMLSMNLVGGGFMVRESPTLASTGQTTISDLGGGNFHIDSFFDVFTEISPDGGSSWFPSASSTRMTLYSTFQDAFVPEPSTWAAGALLGGLAWAGARRRAVRN